MKNFIRRLVDISVNIANAMTTAYSMTYGCEEVTRSFNEEIERRKEINKQKFIDNGAKFIAKETLEHEGWLMPRHIAEIHAEKMFEIAKERGDLDELNKIRKDIVTNLKGENDDGE